MFRNGANWRRGGGGGGSKLRGHWHRFSTHAPTTFYLIIISDMGIQYIYDWAWEFIRLGDNFCSIQNVDSAVWRRDGVQVHIKWSDNELLIDPHKCDGSNWKYFCFFLCVAWLTRISNQGLDMRLNIYQEKKMYLCALWLH